MLNNRKYILLTDKITKIKNLNMRPFIRRYCRLLQWLGHFYIWGRLNLIFELGNISLLRDFFIKPVSRSAISSLQYFISFEEMSSSLAYDFGVIIA